MYILFLTNQKKLKKFISSLTKEEMKRCEFFIVSDEIKSDDLPKKMDYYFLDILITPPDGITNYIIHQDKKNFEDRYYQYLTRPLCHAAINKIAKSCFLDRKNSIVCFGDLEAEFDIPKYIERMFEMYFPEIEIFKFKDWKNDPSTLINYTPEDRNVIINRIIDDATEVGLKLKELEECKNEYDDHVFYYD